MRRYEVVFVLAPTVSEEEVKGAVETFRSAAEEKGAAVLEVNEWGKRRLAYPVKKFTEGFYIILTMEEEAADAVAELERRFRVTDSVIRFLSVRIDEDLKRADKFQSRRARKKKSKKAPRAARTAPASEEKATVAEE